LILRAPGPPCLPRLSDVPTAEPPASRLAQSPVAPPWGRAAGRSLSTLLAEPPFVPPPGPEQRQGNYWMMSQRSGTISYLTFAAGFSLAVYVLFFIACDRNRLELAFFRTFGTNALLAYIIHDMVDDAVKPFIPKASPAWYGGAGLLLSFPITWLFVRHFEKRGVYLRV